VAILVVGGTWTPNNFLYKPSTGARGEGEQKIFESGLERVDTRMGKEIWVGDPGRGTTLQNAITSVGGSQTLLRIPAGTWSIGANFTIPANVTLKPERGAILSIANEVTLSINGGLDAGLYQIFSCTATGKVVFGSGAVKEVYPEWWATNTTQGTTDMTAAIQAAINSMPGTYVTGAETTGGGTVKLSPSIYAASAFEIKTGITVDLASGTHLRTSGTITMNTSSKLHGAGRQLSQLTYSGTSYAVVADSSGNPGNLIDVEISDLWLNASAATSNNPVIYFSNMNHPVVRNVKSSLAPDTSATGAAFVRVERSAYAEISGCVWTGSTFKTRKFITIYNDSDGSRIVHNRFIGLNVAGSECILIDNPNAGNNAATLIDNNCFEYFDVAIRVGNTAGCTVTTPIITNNYFETTRSYEIVLGNTTSQVISPTISGNYFYSQASALHAVYGRNTIGAKIFGNHSLNHSSYVYNFGSYATNLNFSITNNTQGEANLTSASGTGEWDAINGERLSQGLNRKVTADSLIVFSNIPAGTTQSVTVTYATPFKAGTLPNVVATVGDAHAERFQIGVDMSTATNTGCTIYVRNLYTSTQSIYVSYIAVGVR
jgi:hypothetical protein